jgi:hypothetical protein
LIDEALVCNDLPWTKSEIVDCGISKTLEYHVPGTVLWYPSKVAPKDTMKQKSTTYERQAASNGQKSGPQASYHSAYFPKLAKRFKATDVIEFRRGNMIHRFGFHI